MTNERDRVPCAREIAGDQFPHRDQFPLAGSFKTAEANPS